MQIQRTNLAHWVEWQQRCALMRCKPTTQGALRGFAYARFYYYGGHLLGAAEVERVVPEAERCWHLFETHLEVARPRSGRRYKEWLFARLEGSSDQPFDIIQGGASLLVRSVVVIWARNELRKKQTFSLDRTLYPCCSITFTELLAAQTIALEEIEEREIGEIVGVLLPSYRKSLSATERVIILTKHLKLPLYHPAILALCGVGRSRASVIWRNSFVKLATLVRRKFPAEPQGWQLKLALALFRRATDEIVFQGRAEKRLQQLFKMAEEAIAVSRKIG